MLPAEPVFHRLESRVAGNDPLQISLALQLLGQIKGVEATHQGDGYSHLSGLPAPLLRMAKLACHSPSWAATCSTA